MRIQSGIVDQYIYFVAVDSTDYVTRETALTTFTVYRSRNGAAATAYTTPTVAELSAANMPGVYSLLLDEDMTIDSGDDSQEICLHITQASMAPVTRTIELYRPIVTAGATLTVANGAADADLERIQGTVVSTPATAGILDVNVKNIDNDAASASGTVTFPNATLASTTNITAGTITTATNVTTVNGLAANVITAASMASDASNEVAAACGIVTGLTADSGTTTTLVDASLTQSDTDHWKGCTVFFTNGNIVGQARLITGFDPATDTITFSPATTQSVATQAYIILPSGRVDLNSWLGTLVATPTVAGVPAVELIDVSAAGQADVALSVWSADATTYQTQGTFGQAIGDPVADTNTLFKAVVTDATGATVGVDVVALKAETVTILADTDNIQTRLPAALVSGRMDASVGAIAADAITAASLAADAGAEIADAVWDEDATAHQTQGTFGQAIGDPVADTNTIYKAVVSDATGATVGVDVVAVKAETVSILADTNELQVDWVDGGRLDLILDARASQTSVDDLPTNAELATSQAAADDATLAAIAALNNLSSAQVTAAVPTANANADALLDRAAGVETGLTPREAWRLVAAACAGKASGLATATAIYRNPVADSKERITATVDADGNRTAITYDLT